VKKLTTATVDMQFMLGYYKTHEQQSRLEPPCKRPEFTPIVLILLVFDSIFLYGNVGTGG
jgi:hypothetical protein